MVTCVAPAVALSQTDTQEPEPPAYFQRLIEAGGVKFDFYSRPPVGQRHPGKAQFDLSWHPVSSFRAKWKPKNGKQQLSIRVKLKTLTYQSTHTLSLPRNLNNPRRWENRLVKHEFDHVAISADPRARMLAEHLLHRAVQIKVAVDADAEIDDKLVRALIDKEFAARTDAVIELIHSNYALLDKVSRHGTRAIPNRKVFFESLYTKPTLDAAAFPYTGDVLVLLKSKKYRQAELLYDFPEKAK